MNSLALTFSLVLGTIGAGAAAPEPAPSPAISATSATAASIDVIVTPAQCLTWKKTRPALYRNYCI